MLAAFLRPDPLQVAKSAALSSEQPAAAGGGGELAVPLGDRYIRLALLALAIANLAMVGVMAAAPVHLQHHGAGMGTIGLIISAHIAAMYLPAPVTGWLADTFGARAVVGLGALVLLAAAVAAVPGTGHLGIMGALLLLGVGWNAGLIGGSALLRDAPVSPLLRTRAEGLGELGMGAAAAAWAAAPGCCWPPAGSGSSASSRPRPACCSWPCWPPPAGGKGSVVGARSRGGNTTQLSVPATPD